MRPAVKKFPISLIKWSLGIVLLAQAGATYAIERPKVGLVLGGGGARGAAHIGVLQVLEEHRIPVDLIAGTSMGALVGGIYASGHSADELEALVLGIDWPSMFQDAPPRAGRGMRRKREDLAGLAGAELGYSDRRVVVPRGALQGHRLLLWLRRTTLSVAEVQDFSQLPIPFQCVATDIVGGSKAVLGAGDLPLAMRASMAVPGLFAPIRVDGRLMVDGGLVDNIPVSVARQMGAERLIVIDVGSPLATEVELNSPLAVTMQMVTTLMKLETDRTLATLGPGDVFLQPALGNFSAGAFDQAAQAIAVGRAAAEAALPQLQALQLDASEWAAHTEARLQRGGREPVIAGIRIDPTRSASAERVRKAVDELRDGMIDADRLEAALDLAMAEGDYERIGYQIRTVDGEKLLEIQPIDKGWGPGLIRFGFSLGDDFEGNSSYQAEADLRLTGLDERGREWRNRLSLGRRAGLRSELHQPLGGAGRYYGLGFVSYEALEQPVTVLGQRIAEVGIKRVLGGVELGWYPSLAWQLSAGVERGRRRQERTVGSADVVADSSSVDLGALRLAATYDTLDDVGFPQRGTRLDTAVLLYHDAIGSSQEADVLRLRFDRPFTTAAGTLLLGLQADWAFSGRNSGESITGLGGFTRLSGSREDERIGSRSALLRLIGYRRLNEVRLGSVPVYLGFSAEAGQNWLPFEQASLSDLDYAGSIFLGIDSPLGPVYLGFGQTLAGEGAAFLRIGTIIEDLRR